MSENEILLRQFEIEKDEWKSMLNFFKEDGLYLQDRLTKLIKKINGSNLKMLEKLEDFQNRLLQEDLLITLLRAEVLAYEKLLINENGVSGKIFEQQKKLKNEMQLSQKNLYQLLLDYNKIFGDEG